jgi:antitoxin ParD1/3/4
VASGKYSSRLEVMRSAIKLLKDREEKVRSLQSKLIEGEESGFVNNFSPEEHLEELHKKYL